MPCWEISKFTLEFTVANKKLLIEALKREKLAHILTDRNPNNIILKNFKIDLERNEVECSEDMKEFVEKQINGIKRRYSEIALEEVAKRNKWLLKKKADQKFVFRRF